MINIYLLLLLLAEGEAKEPSADPHPTLILTAHIPHTHTEID
jgi:hypothetical protein